MALEQGFIFKVAQHQEIITSFCNMGESGHSTRTVLGLTSQKSISRPQNRRHGVFIPFPGGRAHITLAQRGDGGVAGLLTIANKGRGY